MPVGLPIRIGSTSFELAAHSQKTNNTARNTSRAAQIFPDPHMRSSVIGSIPLQAIDDFVVCFQYRSDALRVQEAGSTPGSKARDSVLPSAARAPSAAGRA